MRALLHYAMDVFVPHVINRMGNLHITSSEIHFHHLNKDIKFQKEKYLGETTRKGSG